MAFSFKGRKIWAQKNLPKQEFYMYFKLING